MLGIHNFKFTDEVMATEIGWSGMAIASKVRDNKAYKYIMLKDDDDKAIALIEVDARAISYIVRAFCASYLDDCKQDIKGFFRKLKNK